MLAVVAFGALVLNAAAWLTYGYDKLQAQGGGRRVSEATLILLAVLGGVGAWIACELLRHKTRKRSFRAGLTIAVAAHLVILFALIVLTPGP